MYINGTQSRIARAILNHSQEQVAKGSGLATKTVTQFEAEEVKPNSQTITALFKYYDRHDILFLSDGIGATKKVKSIIKLEGRSGFRELFDDIYDTALKTGGNMSILFGSPHLFIQNLGEDWYDKHAQRMLEIKNNINFRIIAEKGNRIADGFAQYRWIDQKRFHNYSVYLFGSKVAFINFADDDVSIEVADHPSMRDTYADLFEIVWESITDDI